MSGAWLNIWGGSLRRMGVSDRLQQSLFFKKVSKYTTRLIHRAFFRKKRLIAGSVTASTGEQ
jgi:hypothetical protein